MSSTVLSFFEGACIFKKLPLAVYMTKPDVCKLFPSLLEQTKIKYYLIDFLSYTFELLHSFSKINADSTCSQFMSNIFFVTAGEPKMLGAWLMNKNRQKTQRKALCGMSELTLSNGYYVIDFLVILPLAQLHTVEFNTELSLLNKM